VCRSIEPPQAQLFADDDGEENGGWKDSDRHGAEIDEGGEIAIDGPHGVTTYTSGPRKVGQKFFTRGGHLAEDLAPCGGS